MIIAVGSDHAAYPLKDAVMKHLQERGIETVDLGPDTGEVSRSYVPVAEQAGKLLAEGKADRAIVMCGTGLGISISANKMPGVRAALCTNEYMARMSREHNDANCLAMGGRVVGIPLGLSIVDAWLDADFEAGGRHEARVRELSELETKYRDRDHVTQAPCEG